MQRVGAATCCVNTIETQTATAARGATSTTLPSRMPTCLDLSCASLRYSNSIAHRKLSVFRNNIAIPSAASQVTDPRSSCELSLIYSAQLQRASLLKCCKLCTVFSMPALR
jgi:hypothetical protein